jgi:hypothetical protein
MGNLRILGLVGAGKPGQFPAKSPPEGRQKAVQTKRPPQKAALSVFLICTTLIRIGQAKSASKDSYGKWPLV